MSLPARSDEKTRDADDSDVTTTRRRGRSSAMYCVLLLVVLLLIWSTDFPLSTVGGDARTSEKRSGALKWYPCSTEGAGRDSQNLVTNDSGASTWLARNPLLRWMTPREIALSTDADSSLECLRIDVPLSYDEHIDSGRTVSLPLARRPRDPSEKPTGPPIFLNPGGPGGSGMAFMYSDSAQNVYHLFNGTRDVISFDPRGINGSRPALTCFPSPSARDVFAAASGGLLRSAKDSVTRLLASNQVQGESCSAYGAELGEYISTYYVAHDLRFMAAKVYGTAVEEVKLDYWGFSYGTLLGMSYAQLFPDNVGSLVLDGVVDVDDYMSGAWSSNLANTDDVIQHFYDSCARNAERCVLARTGRASPSNLESPGTESKHRSAGEIRDAVEGLLVSIRDSPMAAWNGTHGGLLTYSVLKSTIITNLYAPASWPRLALHLSELLLGSTAGFYNHYGLVVGRVTNDDGGLGTACGDASRYPQPTELAHMQNLTNALEADSLFMGEYWAMLPLRCQYYPFKPTVVDFSSSSRRGTANGSFVAETPSATSSPTTKTPWKDVLFVGNEFDMVTPLVNARTMRARFGGSHLLKIDGNYGHCSSALKSTCAESVVADFLNGKRPPTPLLQARGKRDGKDSESAELTCGVDVDRGAFEPGQAVREGSPIQADYTYGPI